MDSNWKKLQARKKQVRDRQVVRNSSASRNGAKAKAAANRVSRKRKHPAEAQKPSDRARQKIKTLSGRRGLVQGFVPDPTNLYEEKFDFDSGGSTSGVSELKMEDGDLTQYVAMDCEMVGVGGEEGGEERSVIARVSIVNFQGKVLYDRYVRSEEKVSNYRTAVSGILPAHINGPGAISFEECVKTVSDILGHRILVGHSINHDLKALMIDHPRIAIRDTARYKKYCPYGPRSLRNLAKDVLGLQIQSGQHCSVEDARAALALYKHEATTWERSIRRSKTTRPIRKSKSRSLNGSTSAQVAQVVQPRLVHEDSIHPFA